MRLEVIIAVTILTLIGIEAKRNLLYGDGFVDCTNKAPHLISSYECHLEHQTARVYGYGHIMFKRRIEAMSLQVSIVRNIAGFEDMTILKLQLELCDLLETTQKFKYLDFLAKPLRKYVNETPRCPLKENFNYTITGAFLDADNFPAFIPIGNFTFMASFFDRKKEAGYFKLAGEVMSSKKKRKSSGGKKV